MLIVMKTYAFQSLGEEGSRSVGAKSGGESFAEAPKALPLLTELKSKERKPGYKHLAPLGAKQQTAFCCSQHEFAQVNHILI